MLTTDATSLRSAVFLRAARNWPIKRCTTVAGEIDRQTTLDAIAGEFGLSAAQIEEDQIELDGPLSLLRGTKRYGLKMAVFLPALALCQNCKKIAKVREANLANPILTVSK